MKELSLHILDILQNSIVAGAKLVRLDLVEDTAEDILKFTITDNGKGMSPEMVKSVIDPFTTSRTTRKVGMGIPLLKFAAEATGGKMELSSEEGVGTVISATFGYSHIDRQPLGNMAETMLGIITSHDKMDFIYTHRLDDREYTLDTGELRAALGNIPFTMPEVVLWIKDFLEENEAALYSEDIDEEE